jgi:hypothetical protein
MPSFGPITRGSVMDSILLSKAVHLQSQVAGNGYSRSRRARLDPRGTDCIACDILIPGKIVRFLEQRANVAFVGTRDRNLVPYGNRVSGWRIGADQRTMTILVPDAFTGRLVESLHQNGELAVTVEEFPSHETYQFKGRYLRHRDALAEDVEAVDHVRRRFVRSVKPIFDIQSEDVMKAFVTRPILAVEFEVSEIYLQTPGPGAGSRLIPPPEP